ncbi:MAG: M28 family peptidase [bacterium]
MNRWILVIAATSIVILFIVGGVTQRMISMPGESYQGEIPGLDGEKLALKDRLRGHVDTLAGDIGERNLGRYPDNLKRAANYIETKFREVGYDPIDQSFSVAGDTVRNVYVRLPGESPGEPRLVVGAHYDTVQGSPGANDNATGVAAVLELARHFQGKTEYGPIDFVAFVNEEPPYFTTENMGSARYARRLSANNATVSAMISLETIGYYSQESGSQNYPFPFNFFYPSRGNFIGFVGSFWYRQVVRDGIRAFRENTKFPSQGVAAPSFVPGVGWSDHRSFWEYGYPAFMVTDTALYRYPHYHRPTDVPSQVDYERMTLVTIGLKDVVYELHQGEYGD